MSIPLFFLYKKKRNSNKVNVVNDHLFLEVVEFWFVYFDYVVNIYKIKNIDKSNLKNRAVKSTILQSFSERDQKMKTTPRVLTIFSAILFNFFRLFKINFGILPGGVRSKFDLASFFVLKYSLTHVNVDFHKTFYNDFFKELTNHYDDSLIEILNEIIPKIFFSTLNTSPNFLPSKLIGSPLSLLDFNYEYLKLLLVNKPISIEGIQHGGVYGEWLQNEFEAFERKISKIYYGWGLLERNITQNKYKFYKRTSLRKSIFWIGRDHQHFAEELNFLNGYLKHHNETSHIENYYDLLLDQTIFFLPHPRRCHEIYNGVFQKKSIVVTRDTNRLLAREAKCVIFDTLSHTLFYACLHNRIPFLILIDHLPIRDLTPKSQKLYMYLKAKGVLITWNCCVNRKQFKDEITNKIDQLSSFYSEEKIFDKIDAFLSSNVSLDN